MSTTTETLTGLTVTVSVYLTGLGRTGGVREVRVPLEEMPVHNTAAMLNSVYKYGQNNLRPLSGKRSVSKGDLIQLGNTFYIVDSVGFKKIGAGAATEIMLMVSDAREDGKPIGEYLQRYNGDDEDLQYVRDNYII